jgi:hypothetical protein
VREALIGSRANGREQKVYGRRSPPGFIAAPVGRSGTFLAFAVFTASSTPLAAAAVSRDLKTILNRGELS